MAIGINQHEIVVTVGENGELEVAVKGYRGTGCKALTAAIERDLGTVTNSKTTAEFTQRPVTQVGRQAQR